ncbi:hypothetical protein [Haloarcula salinisoli]|uniref:Uncharacterized protein n=1 Tax=Haloarcula salinisoli TaxID=2487746 RepID=A0A8J7YAT3_9EURY|nr:hypothetical protein [Halomicroarcula salinisoli]MBX0286380.1 hypothetical protein [Halomicroarcula salinisoli]MBX0302132.1 hypothetical protein [Halomicroarcula salinisoli]
MSGGHRTASERRQADERTLRVPSWARLLRSLARGSVGGLVATVVMTVYRIPVFKALPPTAEFWARFVGGGDVEEYFVPGLLLHLLYGVIGGAVYGILASFTDVDDPVARERLSVLGGLAYGLGLSAFGSRVVFVRLLGRELQSEDALVFHVGHAIYGVTLGTFVATSESAGDVYRESRRTRPDTEKQRRDSD